MSKIVKIKALELFDSRGNPTVGVQVFTEKGGEGFAIVPSGASTGSFEALELRDGGKRLFGKGVKNAVDNVNSIIAPKIVGMEAAHFEDTDRRLLELDGTANKEKLGANAILGVSVAAVKAATDEERVPLYKFLSVGDKPTLPRPMMNILNGGAHASNNLDIQEFMIQPTNPSCFEESMEICVDIYHTLKGILRL